MSEYTPHTVAQAEFANGMSFQIDQIKPTGACRITDLSNGQQSYSHNIPNAWKSVMFKANVDQRTHNTTGWTP